MLKSPVIRYVLIALLIIAVIVVTFVYGNRQRQKQISDKEQTQRQQAMSSPTPSPTKAVSPTPSPMQTPKSAGSTPAQLQPVKSDATSNTSVPQTGGEGWYALSVAFLVILYRYNKKLKTDLHQLLLSTRNTTTN